MVYTGLFPIDNKDYENLRDALEKLHVNDPSLMWSPETSVALGFGFRVGFLGLLAHGGRQGAPRARVRSCSHRHEPFGRLPRV